MEYVCGRSGGHFRLRPAPQGIQRLPDEDAMQDVAGVRGSPGLIHKIISFWLHVLLILLHLKTFALSYGSGDMIMSNHNLFYIRRTNS